MKTLSDFKRRFIIGQPVTVDFLGPIPAARTVTRKVFAIRSVDVIFENERESGKAGSHLTWPKADQVTFPDADTATVAHAAGGVPFAVYHFATS
jgi:hypothetical protein